MEDIDEGTDGKGGSQSPRTAVLWETCFQHSIFVDLSEDESLHFSDLESSFPLRPSQEAIASEASLHLSGDEELSALEDSSSSECSGSSSKAEDEKDLVEARSTRQRSPSRRRSLESPPPSSQLLEDQGQNTSDEDQEDLPFDGVLGNPHFNKTSGTESTLSSDGRQTPQAVAESDGIGDGRDIRVAQKGSLIEIPMKEPKLSSHEPSGGGAKDQNRASEPASVAPTGRSGPEARPTDISRLLLRHFSREELCRSVKLIEAETLPEVSLLESVEDTRLSAALPDNPAGSPSEGHLSGGRPRCVNYTNQCSSGGNWDEAEAEGSVGELETADVADCSTTEALSTAGRSDESDGAPSVTSEPENEGPRPTASPAPVETGGVSLARAHSCSELKYGQGQVHYPPPNFSKVAPRVKLPKAPGGPSSMPMAPSTLSRAQSPPGVLGLVRRVLEDSDQAPERPYLFPEQETCPGPLMADHLQAEYDKLLTKYAEAENLIDEMRLGNKPQTSSEDLLQLDSHFESLVPPLLPPAVRLSEELLHQISPEQPIEQDPSDGERMTDELRDIISEFMKKVEEFKVNLNNSPMSLEDQQMMFRSMMEAQDQLERKYISNKEEHRTLEMQNYIGLCRNTGSFDPDRLAEGDIFRIGMHLEDIKEMIDRNACSHLAPPISSSTPTSMPPTLTSPCADPSQSHLSDTSDPSFQHKEQGAWFSASAHELWAAAEGEEKEEASEDQGDGELIPSRESSLSPPPQSQGSPEGPDITAPAAADDDDEEEEEPGVERSCLFLLTTPGDRAPDPPVVHGTRPTGPPRPAQWTHPESIFPQDHTLNTGSDWQLAASDSLDASDSLAANHSLSPTHSLAASSSLDASDSLAASNSLDSSGSPAAVRFPSSPSSKTHNSCPSQRIISPETDSGFGSSDWPPTESVVSSPSNALSASDSEDSSSPLQTAIHPADTTAPPEGRSPPTAGLSGSSKPQIPTQTPGCGGAVDVDLWVESTTKEQPIRRQDRLHQSRRSKVKQHLSEPALSTAMQAPQGGDQTHSCSCNSEALVALQAEMSRLKKDLEEGLVQLPRLAQKMDYLSSKFKPDRHHRPSRTRPRSHPGKHCSSVIQSVVRQSKVWEDKGRPGSRPLNQEDLTSSDQELSRSKDSGKPDDSTVTRQFHDTPAVGDRGSSGSLYLCTELPMAPQSNRYACRGKDERAVPSKERSYPLSTPATQKPLLQVYYASSCSLPASYKVKEPPGASHHQRRSVQSDSALLPSNVFFRRTPSPAWEQLRTDRRAGRRRGSKEEEINRTLDQAIEAARSMKRTTDRMAKSLTADLARAQLRGKLQHGQPLGGGRGSGL